MIAIIKLTTHVEVAGLVEYEDDKEIVINRPLQINYRYFVGSLPSVSFIRYMMFSESSSIIFSKKDVMNICRPREAFVDFYENVVDHYYGEEPEQFVDNDLRIAVGTKQTTSSDRMMQSLLEDMETDGKMAN